MRKFIFAFVFGALILPDAGFTLGLGDIQVNSALNQQLDADIQLLSAVPEDAEQLIVKLATSEQFSRAGIDRPYMLTSLRFATSLRDGVPYIKVTSPKPIKEPFLNFLVEIDWPQGHLLREYTILLDPPIFMGAEPAANSRPAATDANGYSTPGEQRPQTSNSTAAVATPAAGAAATGGQTQSDWQPATQTDITQPRTSYAPPGGHRIQQGDTAWSLANQLRPDGSVTVEQMMIAMLRTNPEVFINGNVNGLKRGYILRAPDYEAINAVSHTEALALVREQNALWREYQQALASGTPASSLDSESAYGSTGAGESDEARLNIVSAGSGAGMSSGEKDPTEMTAEELREQLALTSEQLETERVEKEALNGRVESLEGQVDKMKRMLTIEDQSMADMQAAANDAAGEDTMPMHEAPATDDMTAMHDDMQSGDADAMDHMATEPAVDDAVVSEEQAVGESGEEPVFMDESQSTQDEMVDTAATETQPVVDDQPYVDDMSSDYITPEQNDPLKALLGNPVLLGGIAGGLLLIVLLVVFMIRKRRTASETAEPAPAPAPLPVDEEDDLAGIADDIADDMDEGESLASDDLDTSADEEEFDADSTMVLPSTEDTVVTQAEDLQEAEEDEEEDRDDVIAEAEVYLAYGIYQQAEELLQNAISDNPDRDAYRVKLAETHYAGKNADEFVKAAEGLKERSGTDTKAWAKVAAMGKDLLPDNAMFQSAAADVDLGDLAPKAPEMDFDLDAEEGGEAEAPDLDFSLDDDEPLDLPETSDDETAVLDLDNLDASELEVEDAPAESAAEELEFDLSETDALEAEEVKAEEPDEEEFALDIDAAELDLNTAEEATEEAAEDVDIDIDFGMDEESEAVTEAASSDDIDIDFGLDEDAEAEAATEPEAEAETETAEVDIDMQLDDAPAEEAEAASTAASDDELDMDDEFGDLGDVDEVATKLDLARAYLDMGDNEGTRSILDEVVAEGSDEQKKEAQELLDQLK